MARTRSIKPAFFLNEELAACSALSRILFVGLWTIADKSGRVHDKPRKIRAELLPYDDGADCDTLLAELDAAGFIKRYEVNGCKFLWIPNFGKHQRPHPKEPDSTIPAYPGRAVEKHGEKCTNPAEPEKETEGCAFPSFNPSPFPSFNPSPSNASQEKFRQFWEAYPCDKDGKKVGVEDCRRTFVLLPPHQQDQVLIAVLHYAESSRAKDGYATNPLKFLDSGWPDWLEPAKPHPPPNGENKVMPRAEVEEINRRHAEISNRHRKPAKPP